MLKFLKRNDAFGAPVGVNYKGNDTYQTKLGGCFTLISFILVVIYAI